MIAFLQGSAGVAAIVAALFCAFGAGISIERVGVDCTDRQKQREVVRWGSAAVYLSVIGLIFMYSAGRL